LDGPAAVELREVPEPSRSPQQVLIEVAAAGVNFPDVLQSKGLYQYKPETPFTLGSEVAGTVREVPDGSSLAPGDRVVAFSGTGAFAEAAVADADAVFPLPDNVSFEAGAGLPMNYLNWCEGPRSAPNLPMAQAPHADYRTPMAARQR